MKGNILVKIPYNRRKAGGGGDQGEFEEKRNTNHNEQAILRFSLSTEPEEQRCCYAALNCF